MFVCRPLAALLLLALVAVGCGAPEGRWRAPADPLDANWLDGGSVVRPEHLARLVALGASDPVARRVLDDATAKLGNGQIAALAARFSVCPSTVREAGLTLFRSDRVMVGRSLEELAFGTVTPETQQALALAKNIAARDTKVREEPDVWLVERTLLPDVCIRQALTIAEAYEAVVHELVHALHIEPRYGYDVAATPTDAQAFRMFIAMEPGGEVEAYAVSLPVRIRLKRGAAWTSPLLPLLDPATAQPIAPAQVFAERVLAPPPWGLGYSYGLLRDPLADARRQIAGELSSRVTAMQRLLAQRKEHRAILEQNVSVHTHNIEAHQHNLGIATTQGNAALEDRSRAGLAEARTALDRTRKMLEAGRASEERIATEITSLGSRSEQVRVLLAGP